MRILALIFVLVGISSCSPEKKLQRLLKHHPELIRDTLVTVYDTLTVPGFRIDTLVRHTGRNDTITITKNNVTTKLVVHRDSVFVSQRGEPVQKTSIIQVSVPRVIYESDKKRWTFFWIGISIALVIIVIAEIVFRSIKKI